MMRRVLPALEASGASSSADPPLPTSGSSGASLPVQDAGAFAHPAPYSGEAENCRGFLLQVCLNVNQHPSQFPTEMAKISYLVSFLRGRALQWAGAVWDTGCTQSVTFEQFLTQFKSVFGKPRGDTSASEQLYQIRQGSDNLPDYVIRFRTLAAASGWNDQALTTAYRHGLQPALRHQLAVADDSVGLEGLIAFFLRVAGRVSRSREGSQAGAGVEPMQVDFSRLSTGERQRRRTQGLCLYCSHGGHRINNCPARPLQTLLSSTQARPRTSSHRPSATD